MRQRNYLDPNLLPSLSDMMDYMRSFDDPENIIEFDNEELEVPTHDEEDLYDGP